MTVAVERRRVGRKGRVLEGGAKRGGIDRVDERVRAHQNRVDPLGRGPQRDARNPQPVRLLLQASRVGYDPARSGDEREHLEVADRLDLMHIGPRMDAVLVQHLARSRVDREDEGPAGRVERGDQPSQARGLGICLPVDREHRVRRWLVHPRTLARDRLEEPGRVGHHVADHLRLPFDSLGHERLAGTLVGAEEELCDPVGLDPVALLGHREVAAA